MHFDPRKLFVDERISCRVEVGERIFSFHTRIKDIQTRGILIDHPDLGSAKLEPGSDMLVRYYREDAAYQFISRLLDLYIEGKEILVLLGFPAKITRLQRREHIREWFQGKVQIRSEKKEKFPILGDLISLSVGGIQFSCPRTSIFTSAIDSVDSMIGIICDIEGDGRFQAFAQVRRVSQDPDELKSVRVQAAFHNLDVRVKKQLVQLIEKAQKGKK